MTTREQFAAYIAKLAPLMRLGHWRLDVADDPPIEDSAWAAIKLWEGSYGGTIRISDDLLREGEDLQRRCVVHELVHCHFAQPWLMARKEMGGRTWEHWENVAEYAVEAITELVAPMMPLPEPVESRPSDVGDPA